MTIPSCVVKEIGNISQSKIYSIPVSARTALDSMQDLYNKKNQYLRVNIHFS